MKNNNPIPVVVKRQWQKPEISLLDTDNIDKRQTGQREYHNGNASKVTVPGGAPTPAPATIYNAFNSLS